MAKRVAPGPVRWPVFIRVVMWLLLAQVALGCGDSASPPEGRSAAGPRAPAVPESSGRDKPPPASLELVFTYGSEKRSWIEEVTADFHRAGHRLSDGRGVRVTAIPSGSGECIEELITGRRQAHLTSPASGVFVALGNAQSRARVGRDLLPATEQLVLSPVVLAMWRPMAEKLGWPGRTIGWSDILSLAQHPKGWGSIGNPEWGRFKLGHTHPEFSNSGLIAALAVVYAGAGKRTGLTLEDVASAATPAGQLLSRIEASVVHYGSSTGFFAERMLASGPGYLSAAVLYESSVIEAYGRQAASDFPLVAVYPREGTFWSDHPVGIVDREWVTPAHGEAATAYIRFLRQRPQQEKALRHGFRPGDPEIALSAPIDRAHGADPLQPQNVLPVPEAAVMDGIVRLWRSVKKRGDVLLVMDVSGSMKADEKMIHAREGALQLAEMLSDEDRMSIMVFSSDIRWLARDLALGGQRSQIREKLGGLFADGGTALYDAVAEAHRFLAERQQGRRIAAAVVLSDGADTARRMTLESLMQRIAADAEHSGVRIFTIGYGQDANAEVLSKIAAATRARFYAGDPRNIREVFKDIATFF